MCTCASTGVRDVGSGGSNATSLDSARANSAEANENNSSDAYLIRRDTPLRRAPSSPALPSQGARPSRPQRLGVSPDRGEPVAGRDGRRLRAGRPALRERSFRFYCGEITVTCCVSLFVTDTKPHAARAPLLISGSISMRSELLPASCGYVAARSLMTAKLPPCNEASALSTIAVNGSTSVDPLSTRMPNRVGPSRLYNLD